MVFSSIVFLLYFLPLFILTYYTVNRKFRNTVILLFSIFFYSWGAPKFIFVILGTTLIDFYLVRWMDKANNTHKRKLMLTLSVSINIGLLFYFKYYNFFIDNINVFFSALGVQHIQWIKVIMPIGISFYTFETITYVVDVYRKVHRPLNNFWNYQLYIILFPKLIAGPIIRYHEIAGQIEDRREFETAENVLAGFYRFTIGLAKKVLIANMVGQQADIIFSMDAAERDTFISWLGILAYTFQIYFDFSGYSDMAIGICRMIGFRVPENFNNPYISQSITEFWRRWHITLGNWMRNYLYIPLGGNRVNGKARLYFNLLLVFLASGFWHGASWNFIIWGMYHGFFLIFERMFLLRIYAKTGKFFNIVINFFIVLIGWVFFRIEKFSDALLYLKKMFSINFTGSYVPERSFYFFLIIAVIFSFFAYSSKGEKIQQAIYSVSYTKTMQIGMFILTMLLFICSVSFITSEGFNPFIYFRF